MKKAYDKSHKRSTREVYCRKCGGSGKKNERTCNLCKGDGKVRYFRCLGCERPFPMNDEFNKICPSCKARVSTESYREPYKVILGW